jgi:transposase-like protein
MTRDTDKAIVTVTDNVVDLNTPAPDIEWTDIVEQIAMELVEGDTPEKVIRAVELILVGHPTYTVARKLGIQTNTLRRWLSEYPAMAAAIADGKKLLTKWRLSKLEQQFLTAVERSQEVLELSLTGETADGERVNPKVLPVIAAQARFVIGLFTAQKEQPQQQAVQSNVGIDVTVTHEVGNTLLKANQDALDYLATRLLAQRDGSELEPIEVTYRVVDPRADNAGPLTDEHGNPAFGELGILDDDPEGVKCHICGKRYTDLSRHINSGHAMIVTDYENTFLLEPGSVHSSDRTSHAR